MAAFLLDENVSIRIANHLTALGHHATSIVRAGYGGLPDPDVLLLAQRWQHVLITHNRGDFQLLHRAWRLWGEAWGIRHRHAGILILDQLKGMHAEAFTGHRRTRREAAGHRGHAQRLASRQGLDAKSVTSRPAPLSLGADLAAGPALAAARHMPGCRARGPGEGMTGERFYGPDAVSAAR